jgi:hypothetical protein
MMKDVTPIGKHMIDQADKMAQMQPPLPAEISHQIQSMIIGAGFMGQFGQLKLNIGKTGEKADKFVRLLVFPDAIPEGQPPEIKKEG